MKVFFSKFRTGKKMEPHTGTVRGAAKKEKYQRPENKNMAGKHIGQLDLKTYTFVHGLGGDFKPRNKQK